MNKQESTHLPTPFGTFSPGYFMYHETRIWLKMKHCLGSWNGITASSLLDLPAGQISLIYACDPAVTIFFLKAFTVLHTIYLLPKSKSPFHTQTIYMNDDNKLVVAFICFSIWFKCCRPGNSEACYQWMLLKVQISTWLSTVGINYTIHFICCIVVFFCCIVVHSLKKRTYLKICMFCPVSSNRKVFF